uniref:S1-like domain-containing protein n=1 Tax=Oryza sativa subsp. japonica TaxID=39947 RepID=Q8LIE1_ORYSJ|nr:unknown protein [Oryza sativa Japonica Group]BAD31427.1 unknown protein [Oryza sativa Japonica Group]
MEALPNGMFRVRLENDTIILGYISGKIRSSSIRILMGDRVKIESTPLNSDWRVVEVIDHHAQYAEPARTRQYAYLHLLQIGLHLERLYMNQQRNEEIRADFNQIFKFFFLFHNHLPNKALFEKNLVWLLHRIYGHTFKVLNKRGERPRSKLLERLKLAADSKGRVFLNATCSF